MKNENKQLLILKMNNFEISLAQAAYNKESGEWIFTFASSHDFAKNFLKIKTMHEDKSVEIDDVMGFYPYNCSYCGGLYGKSLKCPLCGIKRVLCGQCNTPTRGVWDDDGVLGKPGESIRDLCPKCYRKIQSGEL
jgi:hypothetical protein